ncbi:efflux transporter outer membrane subunit [Sphingopyxis alaskensis]|uniref:RND efflux system, outer membrane lipoprotein, NodT n=1 Tax=Sphingopyxis alaskensis (strain DSM 13593 / LMG 18877 / RB2256) TaxID=317655 RepID=Q1GNF4_SPHAL|nr:efflux transporter outer membrane subunit [Sphingopyxis alaskensis]ABF54818.1 RND efflux system, outer membrane lipoprotein, NodT [Sphingopyxis alaskensis RB2256]MCM3421149.1 efflux transporter outer membrane subunit [Sphingopyxis alaskensis]
MPRFIFVTTAVLGLLAGCASVPDLGPRPVEAAPGSLVSSASLAAAPGAWPVEGWWQGFGDTQLDRLIAEGLAGSPDVAIAAARVRAAEALAQQAGAALLPRVGAEAGAGGVQQSRNMGIPPQFVPDGVRDTGHVAATFGFDLDLWGRNRAALAAATSEAEAARVDAAQARLMLATGIAAAYADLAGYYDALDVASEAVRVRSATARLAADRARAGLENQANQRQAESRAASATADVVALEEAIAATRHRIAALVGAGPDRGLSITRPQMRRPTLGLPENAGIDLIGRRPDIVAARLRSEAAAKRIDVARADFYPNISLSALVGLQSLGLSNLFDAGSEYGSGGAAISLPIFEGGRLSGRYRGARADYDGAIAAYDRTLIDALRDVADIVASRAATERQLAGRRAALEAAAEASKLANLRYRAGLANQIEQLTAEDSMIALNRAVTDLEARQLALDIALIRALGGGYQAPDPTGDE